MKIAEIKDLTTPELKERLEVELKAYEQKRINHSISPLDNPSAITRSRKQMARMKTELRQREINNK
jgi:large subunit ribosomal protein L29